MQDSITNKPHLDLNTLAKVAAGMLKRDWALLLYLYPIIVLPRLLGSLIIPANSNAILYVYVVERVVYSLFLLAVASRWTRLTFPKVEAVNWIGLLQALLIGLGLWFSYVVPIAAQFLPIPGTEKSLLAILFIPGSIMNLHFFFFFIPIALGIKKLSDILAFSRSLLVADRWIGPKCLLGPIAVLFLSQAVIAGFSPDQRYLWVSIASDALSGLYWLFSTYMCVAVGLHLTQGHSVVLPQTEQLSPALTSASLDAPAWLEAACLPRKGFVMLCLGCLVWAGNLMRLAQLPPAASISIQKVSLAESKITLDLLIHDPDFNLRGFHAVFLSLASQQRTPLAQFPSRASLSTSQRDVLFGFPLSASPQHVQIDFETTRKDEDLRTLTDIFLWYRNTQIAKVDFPLPAAQAGPASANP